MASATYSRVLETCRKVEEGAARLYHRLAQAHWRDAALAALWAKTGREEENHANQLALAIRLRTGASTLKVDAAKAEKALAMVDALIQAAEAAPPPVIQALEEAITLERTFAQFHAEYAVGFSEPAYQQLFQSMMAADRDHVGALETALAALISAKSAAADAGAPDRGVA